MQEVSPMKNFLVWQLLIQFAFSAAKVILYSVERVRKVFINPVGDSILQRWEGRSLNCGLILVLCVTGIAHDTNLWRNINLSSRLAAQCTFINELQIAQASHSLTGNLMSPRDDVNLCVCEWGEEGYNFILWWNRRASCAVSPSRWAPEASPDASTPATSNQKSSPEEQNSKSCASTNRYSPRPPPPISSTSSSDRTRPASSKEPTIANQLASWQQQKTNAPPCRKI